MINPEVIVHLLYGIGVSSVTGALRGGSGSGRFVRTYERDRLLPFTPFARELANRIGSCIGCGACEDRRSSPRAVLELSRGLDQLHLSAPMIAQLASMDREDLLELQARCPADIPFVRMVEMLEQLDGGA
jgi:hypothetical protein